MWIPAHPPKNSVYYVPVLGKIIVGAGGFEVGHNIGVTIGAGLSIEVDGGVTDGNQSQLFVEPGGKFSGYGTVGTITGASSVGIFLDGGILRVGSHSATGGQVLSFNGNGGTGQLTTTAASTIAFTVYGFGGLGGNLISNYDQIALGNFFDQRHYKHD